MNFIHNLIQQQMTAILSSSLVPSLIGAIVPTILQWYPAALRGRVRVLSSFADGGGGGGGGGGRERELIPEQRLDTDPAVPHERRFQPSIRNRDRASSLELINCVQGWYS